MCGTWSVAVANTILPVMRLPQIDSIASVVEVVRGAASVLGGRVGVGGEIVDDVSVQDDVGGVEGKDVTFTEDEEDEVVPVVVEPVGDAPPFVDSRAGGWPGLVGAILP